MCIPSRSLVAEQHRGVKSRKPSITEIDQLLQRAGFGDEGGGAAAYIVGGIADQSGIFAEP